MLNKHHNITFAALIATFVFLCGVSFAAAAEQTTTNAQQPTATVNSYTPDRTYYAFTWRIEQGVFAGVINFVQGTGPQPANYNVSISQTSCAAEEARVQRTEVVLSHCRAYTGTELNTLSQAAQAANAAYTDSLDASPFGYLAKVAECKKEGVISCIVNGALAVVGYWAYQLTSEVLLAISYFFDAILGLSIDQKFIMQPFVSDMWTVLRDVANMAFIFILLYTGIMTMLSGANWQRPVFNVIVIAILLNFSMFTAKVIIDAGNILAVGVYDSMASPSTTTATDSGVSARITRTMQPHLILSAPQKIGPANDVFLVFLIGTVTNILVAWALLRASLLFIGRLIGFWFLLIVSPLAFVSVAMPKLSRLKDWFELLLNLSFVAPVFLFFLYVILRVVSEGGILATLSSAAPHTGNIIFDAVFVPVILTIFLSKALNLAVDYAKKMSGDFGSYGAELVGGAMGAVSLAGTGGVRALGYVGGALAGKGGVLGAVGSAAAKAAHKGRNMTFDVRNISIPGVAGGGSVGSRLGLGEARKDTFETARAAAIKKAEEAAKLEKANAAAPMSIAESVKKAEEKRVEQENKKKARVDTLKAQEKKLEQEVDTAKASGVDYEDEDNKAKAELLIAEEEIKKAANGTPTQKAAASTAYAIAVARKKTTSRELDIYENGEEKLAKIRKEISDLSEKPKS